MYDIVLTEGRMPISVRLDADTEKKLNEVAQSLDRSRGWIMGLKSPRVEIKRLPIQRRSG